MLLKYLSPSFWNFNSRGQLTSAKTLSMVSLSSISSLALFSSRYRLLVRLTNKLNKCWPGFRFLLLKCFSFASEKCWRDFQHLTFTIKNLTFFGCFFICLGFLRSMNTISIFIMKWNIHFFAVFFYLLHKIVVSFIIDDAFNSMNS